VSETPGTGGYDRAYLEERAQVLRRHIVAMTQQAGSGHPGGSLSAADIVAALYFHVLRVRGSEPAWPERDRFVLSKGHACPVLYAALAERGFFPVDELRRLRKLGAMLQGHPDMKTTPGVEMSTGSLGQGLSVAVGMALGIRLNGTGCRVFCLLGDGELQEGQVWEAAMAGAHYRLANLCAIVDANGLQIDGPTEQVMSPAPIADKFRAFGWDVTGIDGHDMDQIVPALTAAGDRPRAVVARTVKGRGVSFMENEAGWHGKAPNEEQAARALAELGAPGRNGGEDQ